MSDMTKFEYVNPRDEDLKNKLQTFAASFDHTIETWAHPIYIAKRGDEWIGYVQIVNAPIVFTAWKPTEGKPPRGLWEAMLQLVGWVRFQFGLGFTTVPLNTQSFYQETMEKLGFKKMGLELYEPRKE